MRMTVNRQLILPALALSLGVVGCVWTPGLAPQAKPPQGIEVQVAPRLAGRVAFPEAREVAATTGEIVNKATIAVLDGNNQTLAATVTDASGNFSLDVSGAFTPIPGAYYTVEALKGLASTGATSNAVRLRTLLQWSGTAWNSCSGGASIVLSPATTAVAIIKATRGTVTYGETMGVLAANDTVSSANGTLSADWQAVRDLIRDLLWRNADPLSRITWGGSSYAALPERTAVAAANTGNGTYSNTWALLDGSIQLTGSLPRPKFASEATASIAGVTGTAITATDGTYLYTKPWWGDTNSSVWTKSGTGFNGTTFGAVVGSGTLDFTNSGAIVGGILYQIRSGAGNSATLWTMNVASFATSSVAINTPIIQRDNGLPTSGDYLASDGSYWYNGAYSINGGSTNGFTVRVYDQTTRAFLRQITLDGANTPYANTSYYTDSMFYDGVYCYALEWLGTGAARLRRYRLADGQLELESSVPQVHPSDAPLGGCYDWVNNKFYFGTHQANVVHRTAGRTFPSSGTWTSAGLDMGSASPLYRRLNFNAVAVNGQTVRIQIRSASTEAALEGASWYGPTGTGDSYTASGALINSVHHGDRWVQVKATLTPGYENAATGLATTPRLYGVSVEAAQ